MAPARCSSCGARRRGQGSFCRKCGAELGALELAGGPGQADEALALAPAGFGSELREVALFMGLVLGLGVTVFIATHVVGDVPELDVAATGLFFLVTLVFGWRSRAEIGALCKAPSARAWGLTAAAIALGLPLLHGAFSLFSLLGFAEYDYLAPYVAHDWPLWIAFALTAGLTPIQEEIVFRGIMQNKLERVLAERDAWIVQAALFSVAHLSPLILITHFAIGLLLGWLRRQSGSLYPGMVVHAAWNAWVLWQLVP